MSATTRAQGEVAAARRHAEDAARGSGFLAMGGMFEYATRFFVALLLARMLGPEDYGLYVLALEAAALFVGISGLGMDDAMVRYVAIMAARRDVTGLRGTLQLGLGVAVAAAAVVGVVMFLIADLIAMGLFEEPRLTLLLRLLAVALPLLMTSNVLSGIARGFERNDVIAVSENVLQPLVRVALLAGIALLGQLDVLAAVVIFGISDIAASLAMAFLLRRGTRVLPELPFRGGDADRHVREVFGFALPLWGSGLLRKSRNRLTSIVLGASIGLSSLGVFAVAGRISAVGHLVVLAVFMSVKPILARLHDQGDRAGMGSLYTTATRWTLAVYLPLFVVLVLLADPILRVFGGNYQAGRTALILLATAELVNAATGICGSMIDMTGHTGTKLMNSVIFTVLLMGGALVLIPRHGIVGAATASLTAVAFVNLLTLLEVWWLERLQPFDRSFLKPIAAAAGAGLLGLWLRTRLGPELSFPVVLLVGAGVGLLYIGLLVLLRLPDHDRHVALRGIHWSRNVVLGWGHAIAVTVSRSRVAP